MRSEVFKPGRVRLPPKSSRIMPRPIFGGQITCEKEIPIKLLIYSLSLSRTIVICPRRP